MKKQEHIYCTRGAGAVTYLFLVSPEEIVIFSWEYVPSLFLRKVFILHHAVIPWLNLPVLNSSFLNS
jgi:hypothetical protein